MSSVDQTELPPSPLACPHAGPAVLESRHAGESQIHVSSVIATRRKKARAVCGICLQEDSILDGWMHRCTSCEICVHVHCARSLGLLCDGHPFKCGGCNFSEAAAASCCLICMRKASSKTVCAFVPVTVDGSDVSLVHAPCLILSRTHRLAPPSALPMRSPSAIMSNPAPDCISSRCCVCRAEVGEMQQCMHVACGKSVHASCAGDLKLVWFATARDYSAGGDGPSKMFMACSMKHVKQEQVFCTCLKPYDTQGSTMIQCDDCRAWFHCDCLGVDDKEDELNELQSKQFRCPECAAKLAQAPPLHHPVFMCDVRRQWSHAPILLPPKFNAPSLASGMSLSSQQDAVTAIAADMLLLILRTSHSTDIPDLKEPTCVACLAVIGPGDIAGSVFSTLSRRLCVSCCSMRQSLLYLCLPGTISSPHKELPMHPKALLVIAQTSDALDSSGVSADLSIQRFHKQLQMLERLVDAWDFSCRFSPDGVLKFLDEAIGWLGNCPSLSEIQRHAHESFAAGLKLKACLENPQLDLSFVFNLMQECRKYCCHSQYELLAASVTQEISEISSKIDCYLESVSNKSALYDKHRHESSKIDLLQPSTLPSLDAVESVLAAAEALRFDSPSAASLRVKVQEMRNWCSQAEEAVNSSDGTLLCALADSMYQIPAFSHPLIGAIEGKMWNIKATKIIKSDKEFSYKFALDFVSRGQNLEEASLSVHKNLMQCVNSASEWESVAQKLCCKKMSKQEAQEHLQLYDHSIKLICDGAQALRSHIELADAWYAEWGAHAENGFEHMCSLPSLRHIIFKYSQFNIQLPCDDVMTSLLQFEPGQVKTIADHAARLLTKKFASLMLRINSGGAVHLFLPEQSVFSCPFDCCPWSHESFVSHSDVILHVSRHIEASEFSDFKSLFVRHQCSLQEAVDLVSQASAFDDDSVTSNSHFISLHDRVSATQEWCNSAEVSRLLVNTADDNILDPRLKEVIFEGVACGLHTPQLESLQRRLISLKIEEAAVSSSSLSLFSLEILVKISQNLGIKFPFGKIRFQTTSCDIPASTVLQTIITEHRNSVDKCSKAMNVHDLAEFLLSFKMLGAAHPLSPMIPLLGFIGKMAEIWKEKALELLKRSPYDSTIPFLAKTILGWKRWIRWFPESESIVKIADQLQKLSVDYKQQIAPTMPCYAANVSSATPVSYTMLLWPVDNESDLHLSNAAGDRETISLHPRCVQMVPLPPRWYTDAAPEANKHAILKSIKKMGSQIIASKLTCKRQDCGVKALTPDCFCSDDCAVQFETDLLKSVENSRIKRRAAARDALSRALSLPHRGVTATADVINRLSAAIESSFLRAIPSGVEVLPDSYFTLLKNRILQIRSFSPGCVRGMVARRIPDETILSHLSSTDISSNVTGTSGSLSNTSFISSIPTLPALPALPFLPELPASARGVKRPSGRTDDGATKADGRSSKMSKHNPMPYKISISGTRVNELCRLACIHNEHDQDVDMATIPSSIVVQGRLAPAAVASFVNQVSNTSGSSKFIALFQISLVSEHGHPSSVLDHVRSLLSIDRVAVAPLGDDCQMYIGLGCQLAQMHIAVHAQSADSLYAVAVLRKGKHVVR